MVHVMHIHIALILRTGTAWVGSIDTSLSGRLDIMFDSLDKRISAAIDADSIELRKAIKTNYI